jgi:hypothetical protein
MPVQCRCDTKPLFRFQRLNFKILFHLGRIPHRSPQFTPPQLQLASGPCKKFCRLQCQCPQITSHTDASSAGLPFFLPSAPDSSHSTSLPSYFTCQLWSCVCHPSIPSGFLLLPRFDCHHPEESPISICFAAVVIEVLKQIDRVVSRRVYGWSWLGAPTLRKPYFFIFSFYFILFYFKQI